MHTWEQSANGTWIRSYKGVAQYLIRSYPDGSFEASRAGTEFKTMGRFFDTLDEAVEEVNKQMNVALPLPIMHPIDPTDLRNSIEKMGGFLVELSA